MFRMWKRLIRIRVIRIRLRVPYVFCPPHGHGIHQMGTWDSHKWDMGYGTRIGHRIHAILYIYWLYPCIALDPAYERKTPHAEIFDSYAGNRPLLMEELLTAALKEEEVGKGRAVILKLLHVHLRKASKKAQLREASKKTKQANNVNHNVTTTPLQLPPQCHQHIIRPWHHNDTIITPQYCHNIAAMPPQCHEAKPQQGHHNTTTKQANNVITMSQYHHNCHKNSSPMPS